MTDGIKIGKCYADIAHEIGVSEKAVRGTAFRLWHTESQDKIRGILIGGESGD